MTLFFALHLLQELSKIAMPVIFNEPLSFLQRLSEYMEHTHLIHQANTMADSIERMKVPQTDMCFPFMKSFTWYVLILNPLSSVLQHLLCRLLRHSGKEQGNHSTHYWERPLSWSGKVRRPQYLTSTRTNREHGFSWFALSV